MPGISRLAQGLGYAGLIPFVGLSGLDIASGNEFFAGLLLLYSLLIASFLGGVHWPIALQKGHVRQLYLAMLPTLISFALSAAGLWLSPVFIFAGFILLFWGLYAMDYLFLREAFLPFEGYLRFRLILTSVVTLSLAAAAIL
jgi:hypothetical protein